MSECEFCKSPKIAGKIMYVVFDCGTQQFKGRSHNRTEICKRITSLEEKVKLLEIEKQESLEAIINLINNGHKV